jgi:dihydroorotase-like cyclic amidohydrolase
MKAVATDLVLGNPDQPNELRKEGLLYKCGGLPLDWYQFRSSVRATLVAGELVWQDGMTDWRDSRAASGLFLRPEYGPK